MSKFELLLDEPERAYFPGDEFRGSLLVETEEKCSCNGLDITFEVSAGGKGNRNSKTLGSVQVASCTWLNETQYRYPFSFRIPDDARPYHGTLLSVSYNVYARGDIPWAVDATDGIPIKISYPNEGLLTYDWDEDAVKKGRSPWFFYVSLLLFLVGVLAMTYVQIEGSSYAPAAFITFVLGSIGLMFFAREWLSAKRLGSVEVGFEMGSEHVSEDKDAFFVVIKAKSTSSIAGISADLKVHEQVVSGSGSSREYHSHPLFESSVRLEKAEEGVYRGRMILPADGECPPSIVFASNSVDWQVTAHVDIPNWPDWTRCVDLIVTPRTTQS